MTEKEIINLVIHNYLHDDTESEMVVKDWLHEQIKKAEMFDEIAKSYYEIRKDMKDRLVGHELGYQTIGTEVSKYVKQYESGTHS